MSQAVRYDEAVRQAKKLTAQYQWEIGDLANRLEPKYGDQTLKRFAEDIGIPYSTLRKYTLTAGAYPENVRARTISFDTHKELASHPDRVTILDSKPTRDEAREIMKERKREELIRKIKAESPPVRASCPTNDPCADKPPMNPLPGLYQCMVHDWKLILKSRRLKQNLEDLEEAEAYLSDLITQLEVVRRKYHS